MISPCLISGKTTDYTELALNFPPPEADKPPALRSHGGVSIITFLK